ncbi:DMT family transporter [Acuticoccus sp. I52.16.1]|uniref:DMT family transporter n=1 Tax=Acuticoccus sp. I52.16.1 TaxID=2928472 RepID=UPI001FCFD966|nr:DMT family transporter [Acuticoccus sp. I52.16.1]UOM34415.1 DMT family transporter [Acuticoccus sp. I52.16.1]
MEPLLVLVALVSAFFFALSLVLTPFALRGAGPLVGGSISVPTSAILFLALSPLTVDWSAWAMPGAAIFVATGALFPAAVTLLSFASNRHNGPNLTGAMGNLSPIFAIAIAAVIFGDVPRLTQIVGIVALIGGLTLLALERSRAVPRAALLFLALPVLSAMIRGGVQPSIKLGMESWPDPFAAVTIGYVMSALVLWGVRLGVAPRGVAVGRGALWYVPVGLCNGAAVLLLYNALSLGPVTMVAPIVATYPIFTLVLDRLIHRGRPLTLATVAGVAISVCGIAVVLAT